MNGTTAGVWMNGMMTGVVLDGMKDCERTHDTSVSSFSLESSEWVKMNLDTGAGVNTFPSNFGAQGLGDGSFHDWIPDGEAWQYQGYNENGLPRSLSGRLTGVHKVLCSAASASAPAPASGAAGIACKEQQDFHVGHNGGYMIPTHSKIGQGMRNHFEIVERVWKERAHSSLSRE